MRKKESVEGMHANVFLHRRWSKKGRERERVYIMENKVSFKREKKERNNNNKKKQIFRTTRL